MSRSHRVEHRGATIHNLRNIINLTGLPPVKGIP